MAILDDIVAGVCVRVTEDLAAAIDTWNALDPGTRPTLAAHLGLTDQEFEAWGGPGSRVDGRGRTRTTLGDAGALQAVIQGRVGGG